MITEAKALAAFALISVVELCEVQLGWFVSCRLANGTWSHTGAVKPMNRAGSIVIIPLRTATGHVLSYQ